MNMRRYVFRRVFQMVPTILVILVLNFLIIRLAPGDLRISRNSNTQFRVIPNGRFAPYRAPNSVEAITVGAQRRAAALETPHPLSAWHR